MDEAALFKALSDSTRLRLAALLAIRGETCVCVLGRALAVPDFRISRALGVLRRAGIVEARREGTWMHYRLPDAGTDLDKRLQACLRRSFLAHPETRADLARLDRAQPADRRRCAGRRKG
jgi:ArsR family transcriptional regulator